MAPTSTFGETRWAACESVIRRFEDAWRAGPRPDVGAYATASGEHAVRLLVELVHIDLEFRLRAGDFVRAEEYRDRFPELADPELLLDLVAAEFALRYRHCPPVFAEELWLRFPEHLCALRARLPADRTGWWATATRPAERAGAPLGGPPVVPGYEVLGELGRGGMGVVYRVRDLLLHREVALKTFATVPRAESCARFAREAEAIARLDHPNIVPVYEVGEWRAPDNGPAVPYFVMKLYAGGSLDAAPAGPGTDARAHARVVETVARAVHHAHQRGVLHRDLKPSNILLDDAGRPYVADFGLAGRLEGAPDTLTAVAGTPAYMAPEQARAPKSVSTAADVYGLGAILYHQLTGRAPFGADTPLATLEQVAGAPPQRPAELNPAVPRDLETICLKCLEKDPARRYASAAEVADDLERWRTGRPIEARPARAWELVWRRARRHPFVSALVALTAIAVATAAGVFVYSYREVERKKRETHEAYVRECAMRYKLEDTLRREQRALYLERVAAAGRLYASNQLAETWALLDQCPPELRGWEWRYLDGLRHAQPFVPAGHTRVVTAVAYAADGRLVSADAGGALRAWDADGRPLRSWKGGGTRVTVLSVHPTRDWVAAADHTAITVWEIGTGRQLAKLTGSEWVAFSPDGMRLAGADGNSVRLWLVPNGATGPDDKPQEWKRFSSIDGHRAAVRSAAFTPDGNVLITVSFDRRIRGWSAARGEELFNRAAAIEVSGLAVVAGGLLAEAHPGYVLFTEPASGEFRDRIDHATGARPAVAAAPDGSAVAVAGANGEVVVWDVAARRKRVYRGHPGAAVSLALGPGGRVAACGGDEAPRVWDTTREPDLRTLAWVGEGVGGIALSPDGTRVAVGPRSPAPATEPRAAVFDTATGRELFRPIAFPDVAFHPRTGHLVTSQLGGGASAWDAGTGAELWARPFAAPRRAGMVTPPGGKRLVVSSNGAQMALWDYRAGGAQLYDPSDGSPRGVIETGTGLVHCLDLSPDGARLAAAAADGVAVWDTATRARVPWECAKPALAVAFAPSGEVLACAEADHTVRLRDAKTGREVRALVGSALRVNALCFSPDGTRLVTGGADAARVWDVETGRELLALPGALGTIRGLAWDAATDRVYALDSAVRVWGTPPRN